MDDRNPKRLLVLSFFITVLSVVFFRDIKSIIDNSFFKEKYILIVGILSAPENVQKRISIRKTWLKLTTDISVAYYFVIGDNICRVHPLDRVNAYTCIENSFTLPPNVTSETEFSTLKRRQEADYPGLPPPLDSVGFGFHTLGCVTVKKLGVVRSFLEHVKCSMKVKLVSSRNKKTMASVTIDGGAAAEPGDSAFVLKSIRPVTLERGAEAQLVMEPVNGNLSLLPGCDAVDWDTAPGLVNYVQLIQAGDRKPWPFRRSSCSYVVMTYCISDVNIFKSQILGKEQRRKEWRNFRRNLMSQLKDESKTYGDVLFINVVDVYRNLPRKLIYFFRKIMTSEYFHYVLKADDDSFIDILRVYKQLVSVSRELDEEIRTNMYDIPSRGMVAGIRLSQFWWWSNYRDFWRVQETGKWRDDRYRSAAYPTFPCGGGYVLNRGIVDYLSENWKNLQYFQGEDVSVGIWLSGLNTMQYRVPRAIQRGVGRDFIQQKVLKDFGGAAAWASFLNLANANRTVPDSCEWTCDNEKRSYNIPLCNKVQLTEGEMYQTWKEYTERGFIL